MDKIKKFIDCYVPVYNCNFKCNYCYISTWSNYDKRNYTEQIPHNPKFIRKALSKKRWGGALMLNFCAAGETLLSKELLPIVKELLEEGHYCMIVTNGVITPKFKEMSKWDMKLKKHLFIKFSYHYLELKRLNFTKIFFENARLMKKSGISFTIELTPSDQYIPYINDIKQECINEIGALPHITVCRKENGKVPIMSKLSKEDYVKTWSTFNSDLFNFKMQIFGVKRNEFCYAGKWSYILELVSGELKQCYRGKTLQNIYEDCSTPIVEEPIGCNCVDPHCWNGHAFLAFGVIPELKTPTFEQERNRKTKNGEWISKEMKSFMSSKLIESNEELDENRKNKFNKLSRKHKLKCNFRKLVGKIVKK